jgi:hypothetical protein
MAVLKKCKVGSECHNFQGKWNENNYFIEYKREPVCLICLDTVSMFKECSLKWHYNTNMLKNMKIYRGR